MKPKNGIDRKKAGASIAGAGGGTALFLLFNTLSDENPVKKPLLFLVPTFSVTVSGISLFLQKQVKFLWKNRKLKVAEKELERVANARLNDPNTSEEQKKEIRKKVEEVQKIGIDNRINKVKALYEDEENEQLNLINTKTN